MIMLDDAVKANGRGDDVVGHGHLPGHGALAASLRASSYRRVVNTPETRR